MGTHRVISLDVGTVRIGVAISSTEGNIALPLDTIHLKNTPDPFPIIQDLLDKEQVKHIVVGLPLALDGSEGPATRRTRQFVAKLRAQIPGIKIFAQDERFTSQVAEDVLMNLKTKAEKKRQLVDSMAAALILQTWLDRRSKHEGN